MISVQYILIFLMMHLLLFSILNYDKKNKVRNLNILIIAVFAIVDAIRYLQAGYHSIQMYDSPLVLGAAVLVLIYSLQGFKKLSRWISVFMSLLIISFISTVSSGFLMTILGIYRREVVYNPVISVLGMMSGLLLMTGFYFVMKNLGIQINIYELTKKNVAIIVFFVIMLGFYIDNLHLMIAAGSSGLRQLINILSLLVGVIPIYGVIYIITQKDYIKYIEAREHEQDLLFKEELVHYDRMNEWNEELAAFKHDIDDELDYLAQLAHHQKSSDISDHITKMRGAVATIVRPMSQNTGSKATDSVWYNLTTNEEYRDVECKWLGKIPHNIMIDSRDLLKLFSNLLKNAFEAAAQSTEEKYVHVEIFDEETRLKSLIRNSHSNEIRKFRDDVFITTKLAKERHGIGTRVIKDVVMKYGGKIKYIYDEKEFHVTVIFGANIYQI